MTFRAPQPTDPHSWMELYMGVGNRHDCMTSMTMFYSTCTQMWLEMEDLHACFCLWGHSAHPQLLLTVQRVQHSGARTSWSASSLESSAMNINMNEGADQPTGSPTGSRRRRAGTKRWTELKTRDGRIKAHLESQLDAPGLGKKRRRDREWGDEGNKPSSCRLTDSSNHFTALTWVTVHI